MSSITKEQLKLRTKQLALRIIKVFAALPHRTEAQVLGRQLLRSGTSVGAQYREATRARSLAEFVSKLESAQQELEETSYWLELLTECGLLPEKRLLPLAKEVNEVQAIFAAAAITTKSPKR
jgi:four helix bundle protein